MNIKIISALGILVAGGLVGWLSNDLEKSANIETTGEVMKTTLESQEVSMVVDASDFVSVRPEVVMLPEQIISLEEKDGLIFMREEEKLARDVYTVLYEKWGVQIFSNIAQSEQTHTEAVKTLLTKYAITDPVSDDIIGVFTNTDLGKLFNDLTARGNISLEEALMVGAIIEDLDIADLQKQISKTDNDDIKLVYDNLIRGSRNHLRSFVSQLTSRNVAYTPQYITQQEFDVILASPQETGSGGNRDRGWGKIR